MCEHFAPSTAKSKLPMNYTHLTQNERYQIYILSRAGHKQNEIAELLNRHSSTISRELARNKGLRGYRPRQAQQLSEVRSGNSRNAPRIAPAVWAAAKAELLLQHSPEQVAARLPVSHETLYRRIYADKREGGDLWRNLRCQKQRRKRYASGQNRRGKIPARRPIAQRAASIEARRRIGHWEGDTLIGRGHKQAIVSLVERKSGFCLLAHVHRKTSEAVRDVIVQSLRPYKARVCTLTFDNGLEFARHAEIDHVLKSTSFFADPYASWQRGTNENTNGLVRQYLPKSRPFHDVTAEELAMIMDRLNHRPRKRLNWKTPHQVFMQSFNRVALRG
jgi:IS30 family transposase